MVLVTPDQRPCVQRRGAGERDGLDSRVAGEGEVSGQQGEALSVIMEPAEQVIEAQVGGGLLGGDAERGGEIPQEIQAAKRGWRPEDAFS